jgi:excisionase family DNA binding protein
MSFQFSTHNPRPHHPNPTSDQPVVPAAASPTPAGPLLHTPAEAAELLNVRESWLRRKAAARQIPCTFLGKHLRFSPADLATIITRHARPATGKPSWRTRRPRTPNVRDHDLSPGPDQSVDASRPDDHDRDGSTTWPG